MGRFCVLWLNILCLAAGKGTINTDNIFKVVMTDEKFAISKRHRNNGNVSALEQWPVFIFKSDLVSVLAAVWVINWLDI